MNTIILKAMDIKQTPQWGNYLEQMGWTPKMVGKTLVLIRIIRPFNFSVIKIIHPYGPLPFEKIDKLAKEFNALFVVIEPHHYKYNPASFPKKGYRVSFMRYTNSATIKIDLKQKEHDLFRSFSENAQRNIKKSLKNNLRVETVFLKNEKTTKHFDQFFKLLENLKKIKKFYTPDYKEYIKKMTAFKDTSYILFAYEKGSKEPIATVWYASYNNVVSYIQTGITQRGYELLANYLLVWEGLKQAQKLKLEVFDFETIYDERYPKDHLSWRGYSEFKKRFHGYTIEYPPTWIKLYNPLFKGLYLCLSIFSKYLD